MVWIRCRAILCVVMWIDYSTPSHHRPRPMIGYSCFCVRRATLSNGPTTDSPTPHDPAQRQTSAKQTGAEARARKQAPRYTHERSRSRDFRQQRRSAVVFHSTQLTQSDDGGRVMLFMITACLERRQAQASLDCSEAGWTRKGLKWHVYWMIGCSHGRPLQIRGGPSKLRMSKPRSKPANRKRSNARNFGANLQLSSFNLCYASLCVPLVSRYFICRRQPQARPPPAPSARPPLERVCVVYVTLRNNNLDRFCLPQPESDNSNPPIGSIVGLVLR